MAEGVPPQKLCGGDGNTKQLCQMAGGTRLVGIISHVSELKQEIDDQLLVTKDHEGSYARWQLS